MAVGLGLVLLACGRLSAELVYFARGGQAQLVARVEGDRVVLETPDGLKDFARADFAAIISGHRPLQNWVDRRDGALLEGSVEARFAAAWWALENGLTDEAIATLEGIRPMARPGTPAARTLAALDRLSLPCPDPEAGVLQGRFRSSSFREARSPHVILLHRMGEGEARERVEVIEHVVQAFHLAFAAQGFELRRPQRRFVSVNFPDRRDYAEFLRSADAGAFVETQGYYHPVLRAVFTFDTRSGVEQQAGRRALANRKAEGEAASEVARRGLLLDLEWRTTDLGIVAHETIHQLIDESGLAPRLDDFPTWLHEGLAAQFEVVRGGRWAGFGHAHDLRLPDWRTIRPLPRLDPLLRDSGFGNGYRRDLYAQSWALVYFLRKARPAEFRTFLDLLRAPRAEGLGHADRSFDAFRSAFGEDIGPLESAWHRYLAEQRTPLEEGRPPGLPGTAAVPGLGSERRLVEPLRSH